MGLLATNRLTEQQFRDRVERSLRSHTEANKIKTFIEAKGYTYTISLYGVIINPETKQPEYRRVEVFINGQPDTVDVGAINNFFADLIPYNYYSLWAYNRQQKELLLIKGFD